MKGKEVREIFEEILPRDVIESWARDVGAVERERRLDIALLVRSAVISAGTATGARQADVVRSYVESGGEAVARSASYRWFDKEFESLMERLSERALAYSRQQERDLPGILGIVEDWLIVDSTTVRLQDIHQESYPGAGKYAALKVHKQLSVGCGAPVAYHFSPAREHDSKHLEIDASWKGKGLLADLGYASLARLQACARNDVLFVIRLKENWKPKVNQIHRGDAQRRFFEGAEFDTLIEDEVLALDGHAVDASVTVGAGKNALALRLVGVEGPRGYCWYLTNIARRYGPRQIATLYRVRWEVELSMKLDKSVHHLAASGENVGRNLHAVRALLHAALIASVIAGLIVHRYNQAVARRTTGKVRKEPPLHVRRLALQLATSCQSIAAAFDESSAAATKQWDRIAKILVHSGKDPNWRTRPSVLDELRGYVPHRATPRRTLRKGSTSDAK